MPDIAPLLPSTPGPQPPASGTSLLPVTPVAADTSMADFLGQLTAALKSLANAVGPLPTVTAGPQTPALQVPPADSEPAPKQPEAALKTSDADADELPELLASLGFVVVPPMLQPQLAVAPDDSDSRLIDQTASSLASALMASAPVAQQRQTIVSGESVPPPDGPTSPPPDGPTSPPPDLPMASTPPSPDLPIPTAGHADAPPTLAASAPTVIQPQLHEGSEPQSGDAGDGHQHRSNRTIRSVDSASIDSTAQGGNDQTFNAAMAQASAPAAAPVQAAAPHPSEVVSQIVHQAELYRLPGNRGVRIQLHPEDLGGLQVTLRYAAGGGLELHINVEHAATGALVQAGWTELRDALATQGISPDRLVMSVTGPDSANQLDFSSSGGGTNRSDAGLAQFGQGGQSDRQHQDGGDDARFSRAWNGRLESTSAADDTPRVASSGAASRIDYRV